MKDEPLRVLVIDDDAAFGRLVRRIAQPMGIEVATSDGADCIEQLRRCRPGIIILDLQMPGIDGIEILRGLAAEQCAARIHLASGSVDDRTLDRAAQLALERGLDIGPVLRKPLTVESLRAVLGAAAPAAPAVADRPAAGCLSAAELAQAIGAGQLFLHYQPQLDLPQGRIDAAEALVRWRHPTRGIVPPDRFIPLAEETGLIEPLTERVIASALAAAGEWRRRGCPLGISINISGHNLRDVGLPDRVGRSCEKFDVPPQSVTLELTESDVMADAVEAMDVLVRLRVKGFQLSVDDFGTGYSSLVRLRRMPFSELKIDRSFVAKLLDDPECSTIVDAIIRLAQKLRLKCVAEGVESAPVLDLLRRLGCDGAQGYYIGRPASAEAVVARAAPQLVAPL
jgi:EAL domain-containing protein (putative c-di-GMP-specific phosphodiesterase class I)/CheY-like chemotaxis protein